MDTQHTGPAVEPAETNGANADQHATPVVPEPASGEGISATPPSMSGLYHPVGIWKLYSEVTTNMNYILEDYIPEGSLTALTAYAKVGKSTWAFALVGAAVHGVAFMGRPTKRSAVVLIAAEEHPREVRLRLERFGVTDRDPVSIHSGDFTSSLENFQALKVHIEDLKTAFGSVLVIVDTIGHVWNVKDENNTQEVLRALRPWLALARVTGAAVVLIHHEGKTQQPGAKALRGASSFAGIVDQILTLRPRDGGARRVLLATGRYAQTPKELVLELDGDCYKVVGSATPGPVKGPAMADRVIAFLVQQPIGQVESATIAAGIDVKPNSTFYDALGALEKRGLVESPRKGAWVITQVGRLGVEAPVEVTA